MRQYTPATARQDPIDRSPVRLSQGRNITGGTVTLTTYTVPAGRRAIVTATVDADVTTALVAGQSVFVSINTTGQTDPAPQISFAPLAAVGTRDHSVVPDIHLAAGDTIVTSMTTGAGAGAVRGIGSVHGVEFDA